jgi:hypothetical protein
LELEFPPVDADTSGEIAAGHPIPEGARMTARLLLTLPGLATPKRPWHADPLPPEPVLADEDDLDDDLEDDDEDDDLEDDDDDFDDEDDDFDDDLDDEDFDDEDDFDDDLDDDLDEDDDDEDDDLDDEE